MRAKTNFLTVIVAFLMIGGSVVLGAYPETFTQVITNGTQNYTLRMKKYSLRGPDFNVLVQNDTGGFDDITASVNPVGTYLGTVDEFSSASAGGVMLSNGVFRSMIYFDTGKSMISDDGDVTSTSGTTMPTWVFPTKSTVQPGQAGDTVYKYQEGTDIDYAVFSQQFGSDPLYTVEMAEFNTLTAAMANLRQAKMIVTVGRLIIRASESQTPYIPANGSLNLGYLANEWSDNHANAKLYCLKMGVAIPNYGGGMANGTYSCNGSGSGKYFVTRRHEDGHNWGSGDYDGGSPEGKTIMCGNNFWYHGGTELNNLFRRRESDLSAGKPIVDIGVFTVVDIPPHAALDAVVCSQGITNSIDVLANDYDANNHSIDLLSCDAISRNGGQIWISEGTGPDGRDEVKYAPAGFLGLDTFAYRIVDSSGQTKTGRVHINVEEFSSEIYEAEDATVVGAVVSGYFVDYQNSSNDYIEWMINASEASDYNLAFYYDYPGNDRPLEIKVDGVVVDPSFDFPDHQLSWGYTTNLLVNLTAGIHTVRATAIGFSGANTDHLKVTKTVDYTGQQNPYFHYNPLTTPYATVGQAYSNTNTLVGNANDLDLNETLTFSKVSGPAWLNVAANGDLSGTPSAGEGGTQAFTVRVTDSTSRTADTILQIYVYDLSAVNSVIYEAEEAYYGDAHVVSSGDFTGNGALDYDASGSSAFVEWTINAPQTNCVGILSFRFALYAATDRPLSISVNGAVVNPSMPFVGINGMTDYEYNPNTLLVPLNAGTNTIRASANGSSGPNMDHLLVDFYANLVNPTNNYPPAFTSDPINEVSANEDIAYTGTITDDASDPDNDLMTFLKVDGPTWLSIASDGTLSGTPDAGDVGANVFTVQVDSTGGSATTTLNIVVDPSNLAPTFTANPITEMAAIQDIAYSGTIADDASDQESDPMTFSKISGPSWLSVASNGDLSGTPLATNIGANVFSVQVDAAGGSDTATLNITVDADLNLAPSFTAGLINGATATEDAVYSGTIADDASDPEGDLMTFEKVTGPVWLSVASDGTLSGTPDAGDIGANIFTVRVTATGGLATATLSITVDAKPNLAPAFTTDPINEANATEGIAYSGTIADDASDPDSDPMTFLKVDGPIWLNVSSTGVLSGTPGAGDVGANVFTVQVDSTGGWDTATLNIDVIIPPLSTDIYEAEDAVYGGASVASNKNGYTGTGFVDYAASGSSAFVEWTFNAVEAGDAVLAIQYASDASDRPLEIQLNGQVVTTQLFGNTGGWTTWDYEQDLNVTVNQGTNTLRASATGLSGANIDHLLVKIFGSIVPEVTYDSWLSDYLSWLGNETNKTDNKDGDALNNLAEYALDGNPTNGTDTSILPIYEMVQVDGSNYVEYIHVRRKDPCDLQYIVEATTNLISGIWTNTPVQIIGTNTAYGVAGFDAITNRVLADPKQQFIHLKIN